jgi:hypothetical protein
MIGAVLAAKLAAAGAVLLLMFLGHRIGGMRNG